MTPADKAATKPDLVQFHLHLPRDLAEQLKKLAADGHRDVTKEVVARLRISFKEHPRL
jgi:hypothetical protein